MLRGENSQDRAGFGSSRGGNEQGERESALDLLLSLNNQLLSLNEVKNILLRRQAPSKHAFSLYMLAYPCYIKLYSIQFCIPSCRSFFVAQTSWQH